MPLSLEALERAAARIPKQPKFPCPENEVERLATLLEYDVLDSPSEQRYDDLTKLATRICEAPIALVSLLDGDRQWFKSHQGINITETPREYAFCTHAIFHSKNLFEIPDTQQDERFCRNPLVTETLGIRFYIGAPLVSSQGFPLGTLCVLDQIPRKLTSAQREALTVLSHQVVAQLELDRTNKQLQQEKQTLHQIQNQLNSTQNSLIQAEKMATVGELVIDISQRLSDPLTFLCGNLHFCNQHVQQLLQSVAQYRAEYMSAEMRSRLNSDREVNYAIADLPKLLSSMRTGVERLQAMFSSLQILSYHTKSSKTLLDLHKGLDAVCNLLQGEFQETSSRQPVILRKHYGDLPKIYGVAGQLNQALMQILLYTLKTLRQEVHPSREIPCIEITTTQVNRKFVEIVIADNGSGMEAETAEKLFESLYEHATVHTGLFTSHLIITHEHEGSMTCRSSIGRGTQIIVRLPICSSKTV